MLVVKPKSRQSPKLGKDFPRATSVSQEAWASLGSEAQSGEKLVLLHDSHSELMLLAKWCFEFRGSLDPEVQKEIQDVHTQTKEDVTNITAPHAALQDSWLFPRQNWGNLYGPCCCCCWWDLPHKAGMRLH